MRRPLYVFVFALVFTTFGQAQTKQPLTLVQTIKLPDVPSGPWTDHLCVDLKRHRLFTTMQAQKVVAVIDLDTAKVIQNIPVGNPHACVYRSDLDQLYVNDGDPENSGVKIFSARDYHLIKHLAFLRRTDAMGYDSDTKYLYAVNGGESENLDYSLISVVNTTTGEKVGDIKIPSAKTLEDMDLESSGPRLYITGVDKNEV